MRTVAVIPARGGSKGIPNKNFIRIDNKPLIYYAIDFCLETHLIDKVVVSTDSKIYKMAIEQKYKTKVDVVDRSEEAASDSATSEMAMLDALNRIKYHDISCLVQCTSPFTDAIDMLRLIREVRDNGRDSATFYTEDWSYFKEIHDISRIVRWLPRQERIPLTRIAGNAWAFKTAKFLIKQNRLFGDIGFVKIDEWKTLEIDNYADVYKADGLARMLRGENAERDF